MHRRVKAWGAANAVPMIFCKAGQRKHRIAEQYLATHEVGTGVFLVLVAKAPAPVWKVKRSAAGRIVNIERRTEYVNHYSFHIVDPVWGHVTIKMSGHPPFGAQIILNGHEYVARQAQAEGTAFTKAGNCFTAIADPAGLARIADALSQDAAVGRLGQICQRWIYSACLCFGLDVDEQHKSGFVYGFAVYQLEYSRNLIFADGATMQQIFDTVVDRTRSRLDVPKLRTIFGAKARPHRDRKHSSVIEAAIETPTYDLTVFKLHFGRLTGKAYTKGERVLRFEAIAHNTAELRCGRMIEKFPEIVSHLAGIAERFATTLDCVDTGFLPDGVLDQLPTGSRLGATRVGGVGSMSTRSECTTRSRPSSLWPRHRTGSPSPTSPQRSTPSPDKPTPTTASAKRHTTYANFAASSSLTSPPARAATGSRHWPPAPSRPCSPCATRSSRPSSPGFAALRWAENPRSGTGWTATTNKSAPTCRPSSTTWPSPPQRR